MIYLDKNSTSITIPCNTSKVFNEYTLILVHGVTNTKYTYTLTDVAVSSLYYLFEETLDIEKGEYNYTLLDSDDKKVSLGLLQFGKIEEEKVTKKFYNRERIIKIYNR